MSEEDYSRHFTRDSFWQKTLKVAAVLGRKGLTAAFTLFYCLQDRDTPNWAKSVIVGALGYLILPLDAIPDFIPGTGLTDDLGALLAAFSVVAAYIKDEHKRHGTAQVERLLGPENKEA